jgi:hypothetical protein
VDPHVWRRQVPVLCKLGDESCCWLHSVRPLNRDHGTFALERKGEDRRLLGHVMPSCLVDLQLSTTISRAFSPPSFLVLAELERINQTTCLSPATGRSGARLRFQRRVEATSEHGQREREASGRIFLFSALNRERLKLRCRSHE